MTLEEMKYVSLSKDLTLHEMVKSVTAKRKGINNIPNQLQIDNMRYFATRIFQPLREYMGKPVYISSGYRSPELNVAIGGSDRSIHYTGGAGDIDNIGGVDLIDTLIFIHDNLPFTELIAEYFPNGWVHAAIIKGREHEKTVKLKDKEHNYQVVTLDYIKKLYGG